MSPLYRPMSCKENFVQAKPLGGSNHIKRESNCSSQRRIAFSQIKSKSNYNEIVQDLDAFNMAEEQIADETLLPRSLF